MARVPVPTRLDLARPPGSTSIFPQTRPPTSQVRWRELVRPGERRADGEELGSSQGVEDGAGLPAAVLRALEVDRDGRRARAVGARRHELGVAEGVARVSEYGAAAGPIAEEREPGGVLAGPAGLGAAAPNELALLGLHGGPEERAAHVAADEPVEVERGGDDAAGGPGPARRRELAPVLEGALAL